MGYIPDVPQNENEPPSASQPKITKNFQELDRIFGKNHTKFSEDGGKHKFLTMPKQDSAPDTGANEGALYLKEVNSKLNLFLRQANGSTEETNLNTNEADLTVQENGKIVFDNNLIIIWGNAESTDPSSDRVTVNFHTPFKQIFWVNFTVEKTSKIRTGDLSLFYLHSFDKSRFVVNTNAGNKKRFYYIAIGT